MLQIPRKVISLGNHSRHFSSLNSVLHSSCDLSGINEAPILDNERILASPEEAKVMKDLETNISVPDLPDLTPVNGIPSSYLTDRRVRIFQPSKTAMQSGTNNIQHWELEFDNRLRWENPLMGWTSSADPLSSVKIRFREPRQAVEYCVRNGWKWFIDVSRAQTEFKAKNYRDNFLWDKRTRTSTK